MKYVYYENSFSYDSFDFHVPVFMILDLLHQTKKVTTFNITTKLGLPLEGNYQ